MGRAAARHAQSPRAPASPLRGDGAHRRLGQRRIVCRQRTPAYDVVPPPARAPPTPGRWQVLVRATWEPATVAPTGDAQPARSWAGPRWTHGRRVRLLASFAPPDGPCGHADRNEEDQPLDHVLDPGQVGELQLQSLDGDRE